MTNIGSDPQAIHRPMFCLRHFKQAFRKIGAVSGPGTSFPSHGNASVKGKHIIANPAAGVQDRGTGRDAEHPPVHGVVTKTLPFHLFR